MKFDYDAFGQRIAKHIYSIGTTPTWEESTYYVRDAQGNVMGTYRLKYEAGGLGFTPFLSYKITERPIYGSSRVGLNGFHRDLLPFAPMTPGQDPYAPSTYPPIRKKMYELSNHLGNVLSVVSDAKFPTVATVGTPIQSYNTDVVSYSDFMPFGSTMTGRNFSSEKYRFGFNGKENDNEVKGQGNQVDFGARIYDPRLGRFLSIDPLAIRYPFYSPYKFAGNNPISFIDKEGKYPIIPSITGRTSLIKQMKESKVKDLLSMMSYFGGADALSAPKNNKQNARYLYSKTNGWIDMRHVAAAALATDKWYVTGDQVLEKGEESEKSQEIQEPSSAWSYEDLVSNKLGVEFEGYLEVNDGEILDVLEKFLNEKGFVENPLEIAPNANEIPSSYPTDPSTKPTAINKTYEPMYTIPEKEVAKKEDNVNTNKDKE